LGDKLTLQFCKHGAVTEETWSSRKIIRIWMKSILNNRINGLSITTVFQAILFILHQVRTRPITLSSQTFCLVLWPCKYWHSPKPAKKQPVNSYSNLGPRWPPPGSTWQCQGQNKCAWFSATHHSYIILLRQSPAIMVEGLLNRPKLPDKNLCNFFFGKFSTNSDRDTAQQFCTTVTVKCKNQCAHKCCTTKKFPCTNLCNFIIKLGTWHTSSGHI
jgi:hypothetical protein